MNTIKISRITIKDLLLLRKISIQTFTETFTATNSAENLAAYVQDKLNLEQLTFEISNPNSQFYIAYANDEAVGYIKLNFDDAQTERIAGNTLEVHRIYVSQAFHGKKIGQLLLDKALQIGKDSGVGSIWLGVWEENHKAIQFYTKNGFVIFDKHDFMMGNDKQTDLLMKLNI
ncbi:Ribosomal protein S18 acetylase RimI [Flavobacterium micromati]|uniref:Ribosomal protein S18 acetylase RimI n=1 Tax=Flavobacterium micromati TaxID=229205 RepID=A0A1M5IKQ1_9FLAO|nr:GNAT family N-acetyltransferase [Flavobacterium micromati]SHG28826.1 Ribosomal protein S18 acetylase RimI [Flavobacterium micromati]